MDNTTPPTPKVGDIWERYDSEDGRWFQYEVTDRLTVGHLLRTDKVGVIMLDGLINSLYWNPWAYRKVRDADDPQ